MEIRSLGYQTDLALLALGGSRIEDRGDHLLVTSPHNPLHWWGNFILVKDTPAAGQASYWLEIFREELPDAEHVAIGIDRGDLVERDLEEFSALQLDVEQSTVMVGTNVEMTAPMPPGAVVRRLVSDEDWAQSVKLRIRCEDRGVEPTAHRRFAEAKVATNRALCEEGLGSWFGSFEGDLLVSQMGLLSAGSAAGRFQSVETDPEARRRGHARAVLAFANRFGFEVLGAERLVMVADPAYFAIDLYRSMGFVDRETQLQIERPVLG